MAYGSRQFVKDLALYTAGAAIGAKLLGSKLLATVVSGALTSIGTSMIIDGVTQMISPQQ